MTAQDFVLFPKVNFVGEQPEASEVLNDPTSHEKAKHSTVLQRQSLKDERTNKMLEVQKNTKTRKSCQNACSILSLLNSAQKEKTKPMLEKIEEAERISISSDGLVNVTTSIDATTFLYNMQQSRKQPSDPDYSNILKNLYISPHLVANSAAK